MHSEIETLERIKVVRDLRKGEYDVLIGINLLREELDLPEVSLAGILKADYADLTEDIDSATLDFSTQQELDTYIANLKSDMREAAK